MGTHDPTGRRWLVDAFYGGAGSKRDIKIGRATL